MTVHVFGVRHHGPGCARSLCAALARLEPDIVLLEGPPDGDALLPMVLDAAMRPPVALLVYRPDMPRRAVFYPFATFSPEWQAIRFALDAHVPVRFCDLPQSMQLALNGDEWQEGAEPDRPDDPLGMLARAAGYPDFELWWEEQIERRTDPVDMFEAILVAMAALRDDAPQPGGVEARREAHMRQAIRAAEREGFDRIAVVCGAWHAPALADRGARASDRDVLTGLKRTAVDAVWIPWTYYRLSYRSGYGAGITSPGWYDHLWTTPRRTTIAWISRAAHLLREERLDAPASGVIDAVRLSDGLAALRDRHAPGLEEVREAIRTTLCHGQDAPMQLIQERLEVGDVMGAVPEGAVAVPLQRDVEMQQRRLRLQVSEAVRELDLDLRRDLDRARSHFLHRLRLLQIPWGVLQNMRSKSSTFHEVWQLQWEPSFIIALIDRAVWGNTLADAAGGFIAQEAKRETDLAVLASMLQSSLLADLPDAASILLGAVHMRAAASPGVQYLMAALPPLAQVARYGDVRGTRVERVLPVIDGLLERVLVELPGACVALDDDAAGQMLGGMQGVRESISLLDRADLRAEWQRVIWQLVEQEVAHPLLRGWCCQVLLEQGVMEGGELQRLARLALSPVTPAEDAASWIEGVLRGSAMLLLHQDELWVALDGWMRGLEEATFAVTLPLLRRAFSNFDQGERRSMGDKVRLLGRGAGKDGLEVPNGAMVDVDRARAAGVIPVLAHILGADARLQNGPL